MLSLNARTANHLTAVRQVQNAGHWITSDAKMAQNVVTENLTAREVLRLTWTEWGSTKNQVITYTLVGEELWRSHFIGGVQHETLVAQYISAISCHFDGGQLTLDVTATVSGWQPATETRIFEVVPRPSL